MARSLLFACAAPALFIAQMAPPVSKPAESFESVAKRAEAARSAERLEEAAALYRKGLALRSNWTEGWWYLATLLYDQDRYAEARDAFRRYVQLEPKAGPGYALLGLCLFQTGDYREAVNALRHAEELKFASDEIRQVAHYHMGLALTKLGQYDAALQVFMKYARRKLNLPSMIEAVGIAALRKPLLPAELPPADRDLVLAVGAALWDAGAAAQQGRPAAERQFRDIVARHPKTPNVHYLFGSFLLGTSSEEALRELLKELEISPDHVPCLVQVAWEYLTGGEAATGLPYARRAVKLDPDSFAPHNILGRLLLDLNQVDEAIRELERARDLAPDSPATRFALGAAYRRAGRTAQALKEMEQFERLKQVVDRQTKERE